MFVFNKNIASAIICFLLSAVLTGLFIAYKFWLYSGSKAMMLSGGIAAANWVIQIIAAILFLGKEKWIFIRRLGGICLVGTLLLFTYNLMNFLPLPLGGFTQFIFAIGIAVAVMTVLYYRAVKKSNLSARWFLLWLGCLAIAIFLQLMVVF